MRLVYLSPVPWLSFAQRPHKYVEWFHAKNEDAVLWIDPYPTRLPVLNDFLMQEAGARSEARSVAALDAPSWLTVACPRSLPIEPLPGSGAVNRLFWNKLLQLVDSFIGKKDCLLVIGKPTELALQLLVRHPCIPSLYDAMDDFPAFYRGISRTSMARREKAIARQVSRIVVSSTGLATRFAGFKEKVVLALNACAVEALPPVGITHKTTEQTVLGYVGTIGAWFDWPLVFALAQANPFMCVRLIGPVYLRPPGQLPANIELLPACDHATAIRSMLEFSVGLIPFKRTDLTASVDPIKYYEYKALGLPVLSTRFGEMALREYSPGVFLLNEKGDLAGQVERALKYEYQKDEVRQFRTENSWEARFEAINIGA